MAYYILTVWKSGGTRPPCPPPNCAHGCTGTFLGAFYRYLQSNLATFCNVVAWSSSPKNLR